MDFHFKSFLGSSKQNFLFPFFHYHFNLHITHCRIFMRTIILFMLFQALKTPKHSLVVRGSTNIYDILVYYKITVCFLLVLHTIISEIQITLKKSLLPLSVICWTLCKNETTLKNYKIKHISRSQLFYIGTKKVTSILAWFCLLMMVHKKHL